MAGDSWKQLERAAKEADDAAKAKPKKAAKKAAKKATGSKKKRPAKRKRTPCKRAAKGFKLVSVYMAPGTEFSIKDRHYKLIEVPLAKKTRSTAHPKPKKKRTKKRRSSS